MATRSKTRAPCEEIWAKGVPLKVTSDGFPILMKPSMNCEYTVEGTEDIAYVGFPQDIPRPELVETLRGFLRTVPRLTAEEFQEAPDGVYTWILASTTGSEPAFYASRTTAMLELGTVHYSIATAVGAVAVHGAGEVWKHADRYTFNFLSGTFMEKWALPAECPLATMQEFLKTKLRSVFPYLVRAKQLEFREDDPTFINSRFLELTTAELEGYVAAGFIVCIHDKGNKAECKSTKSACKKPMALEQMKGGAPPTPRKPQQDGPDRSQFEEAKRMLAFGQVARRDPTELAPVPQSALPGMGRRRKTRKGKTAARKTRRRRGGADDDLDPRHPGVKAAVALVGSNPPPLQAMFRRLERDLKLRPGQVDAMMREYSKAVADGIHPPEDEFRQYLIAKLKLKSTA